jgi:hypothetical protein
MYHVTFLSLPFSTTYGNFKLPKMLWNWMIQNVENQHICSPLTLFNYQMTMD